MDQFRQRTSAFPILTLLYISQSLIVAVQTAVTYLRLHETMSRNTNNPPLPAGHE